MEIYLASTATNQYALENRLYRNIESSLKYIYDSLKKLTSEAIDECDFFDRDYVKEFFTEEYFSKFTRVNCKSEYGEFIIEMAKDSKYQFVFCPSTWVLKSDKSYDSFIVCELEGLELLD